MRNRNQSAMMIKLRTATSAAQKEEETIKRSLGSWRRRCLILAKLHHLYFLSVRNKSRAEEEKEEQAVVFVHRSLIILNRWTRIEEEKEKRRPILHYDDDL